MWRRNHLPPTARIRHSYHELLQICIAEVKSLCEVWVKCLAIHLIRNVRLNWNLHVGHGHSKEFTWTINISSHIPITTNKWCSGKQHTFVPSCPWFEPMPWLIIFATFRDLCLPVGPWNYLWRRGTLYYQKMLTCGTLEKFMTTWNTIFEIMLTRGTLQNFMTTWNTMFFK
jgi:hypothetical protein